MPKNYFLNKVFKKNKTKSLNFIETIKKNEIKLTDYEKKMINNIIEVNDITVKEIIVPRVDVSCIDINSNIMEIIKIIEEKGHSRYPVYEKNIDNIIGIIHSKDLLKFYSANNTFNLNKILKTPIFVPESKLISDLLNEFREKKIHMAVVVDEYGGMSGIICLEDIIEEIVGDIQDEFDNEGDYIQKINDNSYLVNSRISLDDLNERLGTNIIEEDIDTLGGIIFMLFGKIPNKNDKIEYKNYTFTVDSIQGRKIKTIKIDIKKEQINDKT